MLQCPLYFFDIEPLSQKCGEYRKLTDNINELTKYFPTYDAVVERITDFHFCCCLLKRLFIMKKWVFMK